MMIIETTQGHIIMVDDQDYDRLSKFTWHISRDNRTGYQQVRAMKDGKKIKMHRFILGLTDPKVICDHIDGNIFNCQRSNLRACTHRQNMMNRRKRKGTSPYKGVIKRGQKFEAHIKIPEKRLYLGIFVTQELAAQAYNRAAVKYFGEFANLNNIMGMINNNSETQMEISK
jgi:hypothetical protein